MSPAESGVLKPCFEIDPSSLPRLSWASTPKILDFLQPASQISREKNVLVRLTNRKRPCQGFLCQEHLAGEYNICISIRTGPSAIFDLRNVRTLIFKCPVLFPRKFCVFGPEIRQRLVSSGPGYLGRFLQVSLPVFCPGQVLVL